MLSLRIDQSDLKCKNGCDYFGNPQWQGYCSKCHREQMQNKRRAEKEKSSSTLPRPERKPERSLRLAPHSSFSKFEEKRFRQSDALKKANLLKFNMFKKSSTVEEPEHPPEKRAEFKIPPSVNEGMKREFRARFPALAPAVDRDCRVFAHNFALDVVKCANVMSVDELSERVQRQYQRFMKHMDTHANFSNVDADTKELLIDFVEKHAMTYLHDLPGVVFSPSGTEDERLDRAMSERIQQLGWVGERQLECKLDAAPESRQLLYRAISELLGMDGAPAPGGKLARARRCCRLVLALCARAGAAASADDLLPVLIFTVLKANPPRLVSNINFVTRFCNAQRLMTGEGGYYFTNLCCAVSFIENLTAESLNMDKKEFDCYMAMPASIGGSAWAAALSLCAELREAEEQGALAQQLLAQAQLVEQHARDLAADAETFQEEISKKVEDVLAKTPLEIKPRRKRPELAKLKKLNLQPLIELQESQPSTDTEEDESGPDEPEETSDALDRPDGRIMNAVMLNDMTTPLIRAESSIEPTEKLNIMGFEEQEGSPAKSPQNLDRTWDLKQTDSMELLTPSPLGFAPFDSRSIDELVTPDEFGSEHLAPGLSNINYDIDLSDFSGDNSIAEDAPKPKDPFSPEGLRKDAAFEPFAARDPFSPMTDLFEQFSLAGPAPGPAVDPFEVLTDNKDPFSPVGGTSVQNTDTFANDPFSPMQKSNSSILDDNDSPTAACLLPSPLLPQSSTKQA